RDHHRVFARPPHTHALLHAAFIAPDQAATLARITQPAPPFHLLRAHLLFGEQSVMNRAGLLADVRRPRDAARAVRVLIGNPPERMSELVRSDVRTEPVAA